MSVSFDEESGSPYHQPATAFLEGCAAQPEVFCLGWPTLMAYLRIATHSRIFARPLTPASATSNIDTLLALPQVRELSEGERFLECYREVTGELPVRSNLVPDAHLVALLLEHDVPLLYTNDADFKKFGTIGVRNPLSS